MAKRRTGFSVLLLLLLAVWLREAAAQAMEVVHFPSAVVPPRAYKVEQAKAEGRELKPQVGLPIWGHLMKPSGAGPHPAVVLMHGCSGIFPRHVTWARRLKDLGYVTLILDSLRPRSLFNICFGPPGSASPGKRALDAHGALAYLQGLPYVDAARVGVIGWSHGAMSALAAVRASGIAERLPQQFKAVIAFYPLCRGGARFEVPTLILIGEADDWTPSRLCRALVAQNRNGTVPLDLVIYPGAYHGFDVTELAKGYQLEGPAGLSYWLQYDKAAHDDAVERVVDFLADHLSR